MQSFFKNKAKTIAIASTILLLIAAVLYYRQIQIKKAAEAQLDMERKETAQRIREGARLQAEQLRKNPMVIQKDPFAPEETTDADELAQIKLWHQTPPEQRHKLLNN
jgi:hypothetical protein